MSKSKGIDSSRPCSVLFTFTQYNYEAWKDKSVCYWYKTGEVKNRGEKNDFMNVWLEKNTMIPTKKLLRANISWDQILAEQINVLFIYQIQN